MSSEDALGSANAKSGIRKKSYSYSCYSCNYFDDYITYKPYALIDRAEEGANEYYGSTTYTATNMAGQAHEGTTF